MYKISENVKESIVDQIRHVLNKRNYPYTNRAIEKIVDRWELRKESLIDLLSKHPNWNPEKLMIQFDEDYSREFCKSALYGFTNWLKKAIRNSREITDHDIELICFIREDINEQFFNSNMDEKIKKINSINENFKLRNNMKASKAIMKICREMGYDKLPHTGELCNSTSERKKFDDFNYEYAMLCDNINPIKVTRHTCISLNPVDFLLMSNGRNWHSCHDIDYFDDDPGCYSSGTISYMLDECSFIFYTVDAEFSGEDIELEGKLQRQVFGYKDEVFVQSRLYPQSMDSGAEAIYTDIRNVVQKVIADCLEKPNLWTKSVSDVEEIVSRGDGATCYPDWRSGNPGASHCSISKLKGVTSYPSIILGARPICIDCGHEHYTEDNINCCKSGSGEYCACCDRWIDEDDVRWIGDYPYCSGCTVYCGDCGDYELENEACEVNYYRNGHHITKWVCSSCAEDYYRCDSCDEYWSAEDMIRTEEGNHYCPDCGDSYGFCERCETYHDEDCFTYDEETGEYYCDDCYEEIIEERKEEEEYEKAI